MAEVTRGEFRMLANSVGQLSKDVREWRSQHEAEHERDERARIVGRRWLIATLIALAAVIETPIFYIVAHVR